MDLGRFRRISVIGCVSVFLVTALTDIIRSVRSNSALTPVVDIMLKWLLALGTIRYDKLNLIPHFTEFIFKVDKIYKCKERIFTMRIFCRKRYILGFLIITSITIVKN